jgi:hypothetical protein
MGVTLDFLSRKRLVTYGSLWLAPRPDALLAWGFAAGADLTRGRYGFFVGGEGDLEQQPDERSDDYFQAVAGARIGFQKLPVADVYRFGAAVSVHRQLGSEGGVPTDPYFSIALGGKW